MVAVSVDSVSKSFESERVLADVSIDVRDGELMVVLGPSGSGKSTLLRVVAGLEKADEGRILFDGVDVTKTEPAARNIAMVFQDNTLYPFKTVRRNVAFPLEIARTPQDEIERRVVAESRVLAIEQLLDRMPPQLSSGHQQLVQAARAMVRVPGVFLMDEPLARLDAHLRVRMRQELRLLQRGYGVTTMYATNDQAEGLALADRVIVLRDGVVQQIGDPTEIYRRPSNVFVAEFVGLTPMSIVEGSVMRSDGGGVDVKVLGARHRIWAPALAPYAGGRILVGLRPEHLTIVPGEAAVVTHVEDHGDRRYVTMRGEGGAEVVARDPDVAVETRVGIGIQGLHAFDPVTEHAVFHPA